MTNTVVTYKIPNTFLTLSDVTILRKYPQMTQNGSIMLLGLKLVRICFVRKTLAATYKSSKFRNSGLLPDILWCYNTPKISPKLSQNTYWGVRSQPLPPNHAPRGNYKMVRALPNTLKPEINEVRMITEGGGLCQQKQNLAHNLWRFGVKFPKKSRVGRLFQTSEFCRNLKEFELFGEILWDHQIIIIKCY